MCRRIVFPQLVENILAGACRCLGMSQSGMRSKQKKNGQKSAKQLHRALQNRWYLEIACPSGQGHDARGASAKKIIGRADR